MAFDGYELNHRSIYRFFRKSGKTGIDCCMPGVAEYWAVQQYSLDQDKRADSHASCQKLFSAWWDDHEKIIDPPQLINGSDLIREFSLSSGPDIGALLEFVREAQVVEKISSREEAIKIVRTRLQANKWSAYFYWNDCCICRISKTAFFKKI